MSGDSWRSPNKTGKSFLQKLIKRPKNSDLNPKQHMRIVSQAFFEFFLRIFISLLLSIFFRNQFFFPPYICIFTPPKQTRQFFSKILNEPKTHQNQTILLNPAESPPLPINHTLPAHSTRVSKMTLVRSTRVSKKIKNFFSSGVGGFDKIRIF